MKQTKTFKLAYKNAIDFILPYTDVCIAWHTLCFPECL